MFEILGVILSFIAGLLIIALSIIVVAWPLFVMALIVYVIYKLMKRNNKSFK